MRLIKKVWKDPVWSSVIAGFMLALAGWLFKWYVGIWSFILLIWQFISSNYQLILIILLTLIIILQFFLNKKTTKKVTTKKNKDVGLNWLQNLDDHHIQKYFFLFWFPINHRVQTHNMFHDESLDHLPEMIELFHREILVAQPISAIEYVIIIDKKVYDYLEEVYLTEFKDVDEELKRVISTFKSTPFHMLFPKAKLF